MNANDQARRGGVVSPLINHFLQSGLCRDYTEVEGEQCMLVTLSFPTANYQQSYYFNSETMLDGDNCTITGIQLIAEPQLSYLPNGQQNFPDPGERVNQQGVLYVSNLNREVIAELPLYILNKRNNNGKLCFTNFDTQVWQNCYVQFTEASFTTPVRPLAFIVYFVPKIKN